MVKSDACLNCRMRDEDGNAVSPDANLWEAFHNENFFLSHLASLLANNVGGIGCTDAQ